MLGDTLIDFSVPAVIDSGSSFILGPTRGLKSISKVFRKLGCSVDNNYNIACLCKPPEGKVYPDLIFDLTGEKFEMSPEDYMGNSGNGHCFIAIGINDDNFWALGDVFMRKYYINFDMDNKNIGFAKARKTSD
mmetsp:Transcript_18512/g.18498  ORF Transcript_18512/g.18498 Transcript_18512/m.18498 type:complete len:133 (-) Transcript_18512:155-553(-)